MIAAHNAQKQKQEQEQNKLQGYFAMITMSLMAVRHAGLKEGEAFAGAKYEDKLKLHMKEADKTKDQMKENEKNLHGKNMAQQKDIEWYERDSKRLNAENATLKGQVKLWQSPVPMCRPRQNWILWKTTSVLMC